MPLPSETGAVPAAPAFTRFAELRAEAAWSGNQPELVARYHTSPLKIAKSFKHTEGGRTQLAVVQMDGSPGLLEGDRYLFDWHLRAGVGAYVTNQAYTRVHPCPAGGRSGIEQRFRLEKDAVLEWMPEPVMLFRDADFAQVTRVDLAPGAVCAMSDVFCPGRISWGESFGFRSYENKLEVRLSGELVHYQRQKWEPAVLPLASPGCFGGFTHYASFAVFSDRLTTGLADRIRMRLEASDSLPGGIAWGAARTERCGMTVQAAGRAAWPLQCLMLEAWDAVRREMLGLQPLRLLKEAWMG